MKSYLLNALLLEGETVTGMSGLITQIGSLLTSITGWVTSIFTWAIAEPIILFFLALGIAGAMFRWARKLVHF